MKRASVHTPSHYISVLYQLDTGVPALAGEKTTRLQPGLPEMYIDGGVLYRPACTLYALILRYRCLQEKDTIVPEHPSKRTLEDLDLILKDIRYFLDHPRIQQNRWVSKGHTWLPILERTKEDLRSEIEHYDIIADAYQSIWLMLRRLGLEIHQRDRTTWAYSWDGTTPTGAFSSRVEALEAALRERLHQS